MNEYLTAADAFVGGPLPLGCLECLRVDGDRVRYNPATDEFGVLDTNLNIIRTYWVLQGTKSDNMLYYQAQCPRTFP